MDKRGRAKYINMKTRVVGLVACFFLLVGCYYDNEEAIYGIASCSEEAPTFSGRVSAIIETNCIVCHSTSVASGGIVLATYEDVKRQIDNGKLIGAITHSGGFSPMPKNAPKLTTCDIQAIQTWVANQALNN